MAETRRRLVAWQARRVERAHLRDMFAAHQEALERVRATYDMDVEVARIAAELEDEHGGVDRDELKQQVDAWVRARVEQELEILWQEAVDEALAEYGLPRHSPPDAVAPGPRGLAALRW